MVYRYVDRDVVGGLEDGSSWENAYRFLYTALITERCNLQTVHNDSMTILMKASAGTHDNAGCFFDPSWTTSPGYELYIENVDGHDGKWTETSARLDVSATDAFEVTNYGGKPIYLHFKNMQMRSTPFYDYETAFLIPRFGGTGGEITFDKCIFVSEVGQNVPSTTMLYADPDVALTVRNSLFVNKSIYVFGSRTLSLGDFSTDAIIQNCTFAGAPTDNSSENYPDGTIGVYLSSNANEKTVTVQNCIFHNVETPLKVYNDDLSRLPTLIEDYNATDLASNLLMTGTNDRFSQTFSFVDVPTYDYHLTEADTGAQGHGLDLSAFFTEDIDGIERIGTWDIGADQYSVIITFDAEGTATLSGESPTVTFTPTIPTIIDTDGVSGDYSSLAEALTALPNTFDKSYVLECRASTGVVDTSQGIRTLDIGSYDLIIRGDFSNTKRDASAYRLEAFLPDNYPIALTVTNSGGSVYISGLQVGTNNRPGIQVNTTPPLIENCLVYRVDGGTGSGVGFYGNVIDTVFSNCIAVGLGGSGFFGNAAAFCYNCVAINNGNFGFHGRSLRTTVVRNSYAGNNTNGDISLYLNIDYSATADTTNPAGTNNYQSIPCSFTAGAYFLRVVSGEEDLATSNFSFLRGKGTDMSSGGSFGVHSYSTDILGKERTSWDIGVFEFVENQRPFPRMYFH